MLKGNTSKRGIIIGESPRQVVPNVKFADYADCEDKLQLLRARLLPCTIYKQQQQRDAAEQAKRKVGQLKLI